MDNQQLEKLVKALIALPKETEIVEFKENNFNKDEIGKRISGLSNSANLLDKKFAYLVFGIQDQTHNIVGTIFQPTQEKVGNMDLEHWLFQHLDPKIDFRIYEFLFQGKKLVVFKIPPAIDRPVEFTNVPYVRIGSNTRPLKDFPEKERKIWNNIHKNSFEKGISKEGLTGREVLELLDYSKYFSLTNQELPTDTKRFLEKMEQHRLVKKIFDDNYDITNLGAILFANDLKEFESVKRKSTRVIIYDGVSREKIKKEQEGKLGYALGFERLIDYVNDKLPSNEEITKVFREEKKMYPEVAIRELVANALIHQDFTIDGSGPMIEIFDDRLEITNPGKPLIDVNRFIDHPPRSRNEDLASFMRGIRICEELGTGIDRALLGVELYQLPAPKFETYDEFTKVTLYAKKELNEMDDEDKIRACYQHAVLLYVNGRKRMTNESLRGRLRIDKSNYPAASKIIRQAIAAMVIKESEKSKEYIPFWA